MYGQGNYGAAATHTQGGQGPYGSAPPYQPHQPPPPPPIVSSQVGQPGPPPYQQGLRLPFQSSGNSYLSPPPPPPPMHGSIPTPHSQWGAGMQNMPPPPLTRPLHPRPQGQMQYIGTVHPPQPGGLQTFQHAAPASRPHPPNSTYFAPGQYGSFSHLEPQQSHMPPTGPPPPPPPPPLDSSPPGAPPVPPSSPPQKAVESDASDNKGSALDAFAIDSGGSIHSDVLTDGTALKHGDGGGTKAAASNSENLDLPIGPSELVEKSSLNGCVPHSPADSDMDMEDDFTRPDEEEHLIDPSNNLGYVSVLTSNELDMKEQLQNSQNTVELGMVKVVVNENSHRTMSAGPVDKNQGSKVSSLRVGGAVANSPSHAECLLDQIQKSSSLHVGSASESHPNQLSESASPFRLLQDYASDDSSENNDKSLLDKHLEHNRVAELVPRSPSMLEKGPCSVSENATIDPETCADSVMVVMEHRTGTTATRTEEVVTTTEEKEIYSPSFKALEQENALRNNDANAAQGRAYPQKEDGRSISAMSKVDEFGRLVREGASDSERSDSPSYSRRRGKRGRRRSRSRSPDGRRRSRSRSPDGRRRRSPWKRKERRGRSRSVSPKRRRSRSKSPPSRRRGGYDRDKSRTGKGQLQECFDFRRGKCYRGEACRFTHHDSDRIDRSRSSRSKLQYQEPPPTTLRASDRHEEITTVGFSKLVHEDDEPHSRDSKILQDSICVKEGGDMTEEPNRNSIHLSVKDVCMEPGLKSVNKPLSEILSSHVAHGTPSSTVISADQLLQNADSQPQQMDGFSTSKSSSVRTAAIVYPLPTDRAHIEQELITEAGVNSGIKEFASENISSHPVIAVSQDASSPVDQSISRDYNLAPNTTVSPLSASTNNIPPYPAPFPHQHSHFPVQLSSSWNALPPPPPPPLYPSHPSLQFQQNLQPSRNDIPSQTSVLPYPTEMLSHSQGGHRVNYPMQEPHLPPHQADNLRPRIMSAGHMQGAHPLDSIRRENLHPQTTPLSKGSPSEQIHSLPRENLPSREYSSAGYPYLQAPPYGMQHSVPGGVPLHHDEHGKVNPMISRYASDSINKDYSTHLSEFGGSRIANHFNPYASTFDKPLTSKFSLDIVTQGKDVSHGSIYGHPFSLSHSLVDGHGAGRNMIYSANLTGGVEGTSSKPVGDNYDPLFDSMDPSSSRKSSYAKTRETTDESGIMLRHSASDKLLVSEENSKHGGFGAVAVTGSSENDGFGETADAEVGAVENESPSNTDDAADAAAGEVEIDQVKASGKSKKNKDSRSMKLFKVTLADFVKEVLKPSWRQGNMSKEAFKTIVKKTVEKVSGAMKNHHIPKSQAKINHYIDSSQRKLTKLVMGYVDKYAKA